MLSSNCFDQNTLSSKATPQEEKTAPQARTQSSSEKLSQVKQEGRSDTSQTSCYKTPIKMFHYTRKVSKNPPECQKNDEAQPEQTEVTIKKENKAFPGDQVETEQKHSKESTLTSQSKSLSEEESSKLTSSMNSSQLVSQTPSQITSSDEKEEKKEKDIVENPKKDTKEKNRARKRLEALNNTPLYVPTKRVKKGGSFVQENIKLFDKLRNDYVNFRVFKESDLGLNKVMSEKLRQTRIDDDCPTDSEQIEIANVHVQKQLRQAIDFQVSSSSTSQFSNSSLSSSRVLTRYSFASFSFEETQESLNSSESLPSPVSKPSKKKVTKKLSYAIAESNHSPNNRDSQPRDRY